MATKNVPKKGPVSRNALPDRTKPDLKSPKPANLARKPPAAARADSNATNSSDLSSAKKSSPAPRSKGLNNLKRANNVPKPTDKHPIPQEAETNGLEHADPEPLEDSVDMEDSTIELQDHEQRANEEQDEEPTEDAAKALPKASGSGARSVFQRGKDAASSLSGFASKAKNVHSQLPEPVKQEAASRVQSGMKNVKDKAQPAAGEAVSKTEEIPKGANLPTDLSALSGLEVGEDGMILDDDGNEVARLAEGEPEDLAGQTVGENGEILDEDGDLIGRVELLSADAAKKPESFLDADGLNLKDLANLPVAKDGSVKNKSGQVVGNLVEGDPGDLVDSTVNEKGEVLDDDGEVVGRVEPVSLNEAGEQLGEVEDSADAMLPETSILKGRTINEQGKILDEEGGVLGQIPEGQDPATLTGKVPDEQGQVLDDDGEVIGQVEVTPGEAAETAIQKLREDTQEAKKGGQEALDDLSVLDGLQVDEEGQITDPDGNVLGVLDNGDLSEVTGMTVNDKGLIIDDDGNILGKARLVTQESIEEPEKTAQELPPISNLEGLKCNKAGKIVDENGELVGELIEGDPRKLFQADAQLDDRGQFWDNKGNVIGKAQTVPVEEEEEDNGPFANTEDIFVTEEGWVRDANGNKVGKVVEGEIQNLLGRAVDDDGDILDKRGNLLGHAEPWEESEPEEENVDLSVLEGLTPNKLGNVIGPDGVSIARVSEGDLKAVTGRKVDAEGQIWSDDGKVIGRVELIPEDEREDILPFSGFGDLVVRKNGFVEDEAGSIVGKIIEGDPQKLQGLAVDDDGDIVDKRGNVKGRAEPYNPPEEDLSILEGMTVNKLGNIVDENGSVWGRITSGIPKKLAGKQVDAEGQIWSDDGKVIGNAELIPESEREQPEGIFYGLEGLMTAKDGTITDSTGQVVGRLVEGDPARLVGRAVDEDGEIVDKVGNVIGRAERWAPEEKERDISPMSGRKVNREGEIRDEDGNLIGKLTEGNLKSLVGKTVDDNGYIVDNDGNKVGECTLLENLPEEPALSAEEIEQKEKEEHDRDLAKKMSAIVQQTLDSVEPLCKQISDHLEKADRTPREELDEENLVKTVKPLIEEAGNMLQEGKGALRALDPDGQIAASAKARSVSHEATSEEYQLAELLKQLSQTVTTTIDNGRRRIADMPHAKKKLNPLWSLLSEPLFQIIAAVGLLLSGVVGLLGRLLDGLGLGGLVRGLLGGLGIDNLLSGLGLGDVGKSLGMSG
ncbi:hypothetical protein N7510_009302 [Penicillium lagena]|uniref:uncharacterized protein n=1 Tax=Penicillium lagena TaxID=94218 RepID=UPI00254140C7|nr:uncharacterized protein N7510_009302 [Penicillium lagena]KAJ5606521.1 hypothetical protein N7510_009302 [Penicillium lagena]